MPAKARKREPRMPLATTAMQWLRRGVPLTLVMDLLDRNGPDSKRIMHDEPGDTSWVPAPRSDS